MAIPYEAHIKKISRIKPLAVSLRISGAYLLTGALWIVFSDKLIAGIAADKDILTRIGMFKGFVFIALTGGILFLLIYRAMLRKNAAEREQQLHYAELLDNREKLHRMAFEDSCTGLPNRTALYETAQLREGASLFYIDLDDFKYVNDTMGHAFGDELIRVISGKLQAGLHPRDRLFRIGGDEWVILFPQSHDSLQYWSDTLLGLFNSPVEVGDRRVHVTASVGIARYPRDGNGLEDLLKNADIALYRVKRQEKNGYAFYEPSLSVPVRQRANIEHLLRKALAGNEFELNYQPQIDLDSGQLEGFEALLRWNSPEMGRVSPDTFIRIAEETQLIVPIGDWVMRTACAFIRSVHGNGGALPHISVNVSVVQLLDELFVEKVLGVLRETGLEPRHLELEVTESMVIESLDQIGDKLLRLHSEGVRIALDDFGKGYSSLSHLMKLPISTLKIDKSFIDQVPEPNADRPLTGLIIQLAKAMGIKVVAEGVEKKTQLEYLRKYSCNCIQGYLYSKPLPAADAAAWQRPGKLVGF